MKRRLDAIRRIIENERRAERRRERRVRESHADRDHLRHPLQHRSAHRGPAGRRPAEGRPHRLARGRRRVRRVPQPVLRSGAVGAPRSRCSATMTPPSPGGWTTRSITTPRATRSTGRRTCSRTRTSTGCGASRTPTGSATSASATARPSSPKAYEYIFALEQARELMPYVRGPARGHVHRAQPPVQGVRDRQRRSERRGRPEVRRPPGLQVHHLGRQRRASRATTTTAPAS